MNEMTTTLITNAIPRVGLRVRRGCVLETCGVAYGDNKNWVSVRRSNLGDYKQWLMYRGCLFLVTCHGDIRSGVFCQKLQTCLTWQRMSGWERHIKKRHRSQQSSWFLHTSSSHTCLLLTWYHYWELGAEQKVMSNINFEIPCSVSV